MNEEELAQILASGVELGHVKIVGYKNGAPLYELTESGREWYQQTLREFRDEHEDGFI